MAGVKLESIITAIAALSVTMKNGKTLKILKASTIPESAANLGAVLFPKPDGFITNLSAAPQTYGSNGAERIDVTYTMTWVFCDIPGGAGRAIGDNYTVLVYDVIQILNALITHDAISSGCDMRVQNVGNFGIVYDPGGRAYYGTEIELVVREFYVV